MIGFRQIIFILGVIFLIRLIGKIMQARRNVNDQKNNQFNKNQAATDRKKAQQQFGKTTVEKVDSNNIKDSEFSEFEEL